MAGEEKQPPRKTRPRQTATLTDPKPPRSVGKHSSDWTDPESGIVQKVRKIFELETTPSVNEQSDRAVGTVEIRVTEGAELWNQDRDAWQGMTPTEFHRWRGGSQDTHQATATILKLLNDPNGRPSVVRLEATGDGSKTPTSDYNETENGINITIEWAQDSVTIHWSSAQTERQSKDIRLPFSDRFQNNESSEQDAGSKGDRRR